MKSLFLRARAAIRHDAALPRIRDEREKFATDWSEFSGARFLQRLLAIHPAAIKQLERAANLIAFDRGKARPSHAKDIDSEDDVSFCGEKEWRDVFAESGTALRHDETTDMRELVKHCASTNESAVVDPDIAAEEAIVRDDHTVADSAIMAHVHTGHEKVAIADSGGTFFSAAAVNSAVLTDYIPVPNFNAAECFRPKGEILRQPSDDRAVTNEVVSSKADSTLKHRV